MGTEGGILGRHINCDGEPPVTPRLLNNSVWEAHAGLNCFESVETGPVVDLAAPNGDDYDAMSLEGCKASCEQMRVRWDRGAERSGARAVVLLSSPCKGEPNELCQRRWRLE